VIYGSDDTPLQLSVDGSNVAYIGPGSSVRFSIDVHGRNSLLFDTYSVRFPLPAKSRYRRGTAQPTPIHDENMLEWHITPGMPDQLPITFEIQFDDSIELGS